MNNIKKSNNNKKQCTVINKDEIIKDINNLFNDLGPIHTKKVLIETPVKAIEANIYKKTDEYLFTMKNEKIAIDDILSIKRIS